jgi:hypothetical protein
MRPALAPAAAQSLPGLGEIVSHVRRVVHLAGLTGWLLGFIVVLLAWQIALFLALFSGVIQLGAYAGIHFLGCLALAAWLVRRLSSSVVDERNSTALQIVAWSAFTGPFGAFVATALALPTALTPLSVPPDGDADDLTTERSAMERLERAHIALLDRRVRLEGASRISPLMDVIAEGSRSEKLEALRVVYRRYEARLSAVLKRALQDPDTSVRVLAATVIAKLHATYSRNIGDRQIEAAADPKLAQNWHTLAEARLAYAQSGLLESPRVRAQIEFAIGDLSLAAELDPAGGASATLLHSARRRLAVGEMIPSSDTQASYKHF